jgi:hypothetical protein
MRNRIYTRGRAGSYYLCLRFHKRGQQRARAFITVRATVRALADHFPQNAPNGWIAHAAKFEKKRKMIPLLRIQAENPGQGVDDGRRGMDAAMDEKQEGGRGFHSDCGGDIAMRSARLETLEFPEAMQEAFSGIQIIGNPYRIGMDVHLAGLDA